MTHARNRSPDSYSGLTAGCRQPLRQTLIWGLHPALQLPPPFDAPASKLVLAVDRVFATDNGSCAGDGYSLEADSGSAAIFRICPQASCSLCCSCRSSWRFHGTFPPARAQRSTFLAVLRSSSSSLGSFWVSRNRINLWTCSLNAPTVAV